MDGSDLGAGQGSKFHSADAFRDYETGQACIVEQVFAQGGYALGQSDSGQVDAIGKCCFTNGQCANALFKYDLIQLLAAFKSIFTNMGDILTDIHLGDLGVILEDLGADFLKIRVQFTHIAIQVSGIEQQFRVILCIQRAAKIHKMRIGGIHNDLRNRIASGKHGGIEIIQHSRQINDSQSGTACKYIRTEGDLLLAGLENYTLNTLTTGKHTISQARRGGRDHSLF